MNALEFLLFWYRGQCNGAWEHANGITIESLDNPGWMVTIDLAESPLEDSLMQTVRQDHSAADWMICQVDHNRFRGQGDPQKLPAILQTFQNWALQVAKLK